MNATVSDSTLRASLSGMVAERVDVLLADLATQRMLASKGISIPDARAFLNERTYRVMAAEAGL